MDLNAGSPDRNRPHLAGINVTPLIAVMLVLLVVCIVTAPTMKRIEALEIDLPEVAEPGAEIVLTEDARVLAVTAEGTVVKPGSTDERYESMAALIGDLKQYRDDCEKAHRKAVVVVAGDKDTPYQKIMQVWNAVRSAGVREVCFQVESRERNAKK
jgi:biopolymer transport protein TolR